LVKKTTWILSVSWLLLGLSCGLTPGSQLYERAKDYYTAWEFKDYSTMYAYLNDWGRSRVGEDTFVRFMATLDGAEGDFYRADDLEADFLRGMQTGGIEACKVEEVYIRDGVGRVKVFVKTSKDLLGESFIDPNVWEKEDGEWRLAMGPQSPLFLNIQQWLGKTGKFEAPVEQSTPAVDQRKNLVQSVREDFKVLEKMIEGYVAAYQKYPAALEDLPDHPRLLDPFSEGGQYRYYSDGMNYWIVASNGPDGDADIELEKFKGFENNYPPAVLVYDPGRGEGDIYNFGPK
jgi:hypothetical protein